MLFKVHVSTARHVRVYLVWGRGVPLPLAGGWSWVILQGPSQPNPPCDTGFRSATFMHSTWGYSCHFCLILEIGLFLLDKENKQGYKLTQD